MKRLAALVVVVLCGCPDWEAERQMRCATLGSVEGVCADAGRVGTGGGGATGGGSAGGGNGADAGNFDGGWADAGISDAGGQRFPLLIPPQPPLLTSANSSDPLRRVPVFLWEEPFAHLVVAVEQVFDGGTTFWREPDAFAVGSIPYRWCASATNPTSSLLGSAVTNDALVSTINVDDFAMSSVLGTPDLTPTPCPDALAQYQRADGGQVFMGVRADPGGVVHFEQRWRCGSGTCSRDVVAGLSVNRIDEAVVDDTQQTWVSGRFSNLPKVIQVPFELTTPSQLMPTSPGSTVPTTSRVELAVRGGTVMSAWLAMDTLTFLRLDSPSAARQFNLGQPATLVDLVTGAKGSVAVLTLSNRRTVLVLFDGTAADFFELELPFAFQPTVAHLGSSLRIAGLCVEPDAGRCPANLSAPNNPIFDFPTRPDGGAW